jgi:predicted short-subunit dehydrogenase-like oxidoreductase (DUF2520 family)
MRATRISIVGAGKLGTALAMSLRRAGFRVEAIVSRSQGTSLRKAQRLARNIGARAVVMPKNLVAEIIWICVPDSDIARTARQYSKRLRWKGKIALHSSGALSSDELDALRRQGASVASVHPLMTFVRASEPSLGGVPFAIEGDVAAVRAARNIIRSLGGTSHLIAKRDKPAYHAWGTFVSPLLTSLLVTAEHVAGLAGISAKKARHRMSPILLRTVQNYSAFGGAAGFSGPIIRGDEETVRQHLRVLRALPAARCVYRALASAALEFLPAKNKNLLTAILESEKGATRTRKVNQSELKRGKSSARIES